jgi:hypothetical protein
MKTNKIDWRTRLAGKAVSNVYFGGASALVIAKRMDRMNLPSSDTAADIVNYVYHHDKKGPFETVKCEWCDQEFLPYDSGLDNFCSKDCGEQYNT